MKKILLLAVLAALGWYYFIGSRRLDEQLVRDFYAEQTRATLSRNPQALCDQLADDFHGMDSSSAGGRRQQEESNKEQACENAKSVYDSFAQIGTRMGGIVQLDYAHQIESIAISDDKKTAIVKTKFTLDVAGQVMRFRGSSTDTLIRRNSQVLALRSESVTRILSPE